MFLTIFYIFILFISSAGESADGAAGVRGSSQCWRCSVFFRLAFYAAVIFCRLWVYSQEESN